MLLNDRINALSALGDWINNERDTLAPVIEKAYWSNPWFTEENTNKALDAIANNYLNADKLIQWTDNYTIKENNKPKTVGLIMAGNLPLVGFHDLLTVLISGNKAQIKLSSKDSILTTALVIQLIKLEPEFGKQIDIVDRLESFDAIIATGSDNSSRYFDYYFGKYPNIIRKNRNSVAILSGKETKEDLIALGQDVFQYFGLGCRNVSFMLLPKGFEIPKILEAWEAYLDVMDHDKYKNNYDYQRTLLLMNTIEHYASDYVMLREIDQIPSPITTVHYKFYNSLEEANNFINQNKESIQCVVGATENALPFGQAQNPELWDYADSKDTIKFLLGL